MNRWPKVQLVQVQVGSHIAQNHSSNPYHLYRKWYLVIICPNSHGKLTKSEIRSVQVGSNIAQNRSSGPYMKSYLVIIIHMKSWPKIKLGQVQMG